MSLVSAVFQISRNGSGLINLVNYIDKNIGFDAHLIDRIEASQLTTNVSLVTVFHRKYSDDMVSSISPRPNYILTSDAANSNLTLRLLFTHQISPNQPDGVIVIDGTELDNSQFSLDSTGYIGTVDLSSYVSSGHHSYIIDNTKLRRVDGSLYTRSFVGGYTVHVQSAPWMGDTPSNRVKIRGQVSADLIYLNKSQAIQASIDQFLRTRNVPPEYLIGVATVTRQSNQIELYIVYVSNPEPQIIYTFPAFDALIPTDKAPTSIKITYSTPIDETSATLAAGSFALYTSDTQTLIDPSDVTLLDDGRTVEVAISSYATAANAYSLVSRQGLRSVKGFSKSKPELVNFVLDKYEGGGTGGGGTGDITKADVMRRIAFRGMGA